MRIGIDLGGTKIAGIVLDGGGKTQWSNRIPTPKQDYDATIAAVRDLIVQAETETGTKATVGIGIPGSQVRATGRVQNSNLTWINGRPFCADLSAALGRDVRVANDAHCFALSEAVDGAAADCRAVFGVIIGTGCGGGLVFDGRIIDGPNGIGGEWGHMPLPWPTPDESPGPMCWCGRRGCMEMWVSGTALERDHQTVTGHALRAPEIVANAADRACQATLDRHLSRLARGLAVVIDIFDPDTIVLGGGLSNMPHLYDQLPDAVRPHVFADDPAIDIRPPKYGDSSGVRGAAWLWDGSPDGG